MVIGKIPLFGVFLGLFFSIPFLQAEVVVYTSVDEILSSQVFERIAEQTGLKILPVYDSESTKTTGLYLRILQESPNTRADVFWNSEFSRTLLLAKEGLLEEYRSPMAREIPNQFKDPRGRWTGFSARARVLCFNPDLIQPSEVPTSATGLLDTRWKGKVAWANPMFGTTATHCGALLQLWGEKIYSDRVSVFNQNFTRLIGNGQVAQLVARGRFVMGLTDTDDVWRLKLKGRPIEMIPFDKEGAGTLLIPNTVAILKGAPHPEEARKLVDALLQPEIEKQLAETDSRQWPVRTDIPVPEDLGSIDEIRTLTLNYRSISDSVDRAVEIVRKRILEE